MRTGTRHPAARASAPLPRHSRRRPKAGLPEAREIIVGYSEKQRLLLVAFIERTPRVRIISARGASRPNRFASRMAEDAVAVVLEPDVAQVFDSSATVNRLLRSVIAALPQRG